MFKYLKRRLLMLIPLLLVVSIIVFSMIHLMPGDPAMIIAGEGASQADIEAVKHKHGLDKPLFVQYFTWLGNIIRGDFGKSLRTGRPISQEIGFRFVNTIKLATLAIVIGSILGLVMGIVSATKRYSFFDNVTMVIAMVGVSITPFYLGLMSILLFSVKLGWLPMMGVESWKGWILPATTLAFRPAAMIARMTRSNMLEILGQDYILSARALGLPNKVVFVKYALRNALNTVVTVIGLQLGLLMGGAVMTETVFSLPGIGRLAVESIKGRDFPSIQVSVLLIALSFVIINLAVDILYAIINPRISYN
ncbi:MAG TPA: ABC transporter permease [Bacillota bacterium]|nr:ABC transporter permease [Clostridiaceae bacterium]HNR03224.1 ABC transporter permease [Bacillota bacterium]HNT02975.1 ABC transporter permease [Bacillota bacterium]HPA54101.1 ABC transporter permease [Bacillota bacterium]HPX67781.1 ABC transporter permease [Bacillota bacterium]